MLTPEKGDHEKNNLDVLQKESDSTAKLYHQQRLRKKINNGKQNLKSDNTVQHYSFQELPLNLTHVYNREQVL